MDFWNDVRAYGEGVSAGTRALSSAFCPYPWGSLQRPFWLAGWKDARTLMELAPRAREGVQQ